MDTIHHRLKTYWAIGISLTLICLLLFNSGWQGDAQLHTLMEALATLLALFVGALSLTRFYSHGGAKFLILGAGFIGIASLDGYHTVVTSIWFKDFFPSDLSSLIPWSWLASRLLFSLILLSIILNDRLDLENTMPTITRPKVIFSITAFATLSSFLFFAFVPLPSGYFENALLYRPEELIPASIFLVALILHIKQNNWRHDNFEHWVIIAIIFNLVAQFSVMPYSSSLFDTQFDIAHLLKKISYMCILVGLFISVFKAFHKNTEEIITRKQSQQALEASEARNRTLMNSLNDGLITISDKGLIESINVAGCKLFGYSKLELLGRNIKMLMPTPYHEEHDDYLSNYAKTGVKHVIGIGRKVTGLRKDKSTFPLDLSVSEMFIGDSKKYSGIIRDDTERLKTEKIIIQSKNEAEAANYAKSNFLATMSHEIRTPMNGVIGMVQILNNTKLDLNQKDIVKTISESGHALLNLINDILEISKIDADKIEFEHKDYNLERTIYDVIKLLNINANQKNIELYFHFHGDCPHYVNGDSSRTRQILLNLVGNAIKFTDQGSVTIDISCTMQIDDSCTVKFQIIDTGIGIRKADQEKLFESFTQADSSTSRKYGGTGLGLSICKKLVELMGGKITVDSAPGKGANFSFELTLKVASNKETHSHDKLIKTNILLAINDSKNREILIDHFHILEMVINTPSTNEAVIQALENAQETNSPYQFIIIDNMFDTDNVEKITNLISTDTSHLIMFNSNQNTEQSNIHEDNNYKATINTPIFSELLYDTLNRAFDSTSHENVNNTLGEETINTPPLQLKGKILLAEDVIVNQKVALGLISDFNLDVDIANNGEEAVILFNQNHYDLILMDCQMPIMDGFQATQKIRETDEKIPIIAITANALSTDKQKCLDAGMSDYLSKPYTKEQILNILDKWINNTNIDTKKVSVSASLNEIPEDDTLQHAVDYTKLEEMKSIMGDVFPELYLHI